MTDWPASLPQYLSVQGFSEEIPNTMLRSNVDTGPAKLRRRYTAAPEPIVGTITCTSAQVDTFRTFFETTLNGGTTSFNWVHPRKQTAATFRFTETPKVSALGGDGFRIGLKMEIMP
jgi:hypothetical protein